MTKEQLAERIKDLTIAGSVLNQRYSGTIALFNAACLENNTELMDQYRLTVQSIVDQILDNNALQLMLTRQLLSMGGGFPT